MRPTIETESAAVYQGSCLEVLPRLPEKFVHTCATSPPYFNLRDYQTQEWRGGKSDCKHKRPRVTHVFPRKLECKDCGARATDHQLGLEGTPQEYVENLVGVMRGVKRVLRDDGTVWVNLGDTYREKQLLGVPWRFAFAMQDDGWYLRSAVIWHKLTGMPEPVADRPTKSYEHFFMFSKCPKYFYDRLAVYTPLKPSTVDRYRYGQGGPKTEFMYEQDKDGIGCRMRFRRKGSAPLPEGSNLRDVWSITPAMLKDSHFAVFPPKLVLRPILACTSLKGCCPQCESPWGRRVKAEREATRPGRVSKLGSIKKDNAKVAGYRDQGRHLTTYTTLGWEPTCDCEHAEKDLVPCTVLDPFAGSGTTLEVAVKHHRRAVGIELNPDYVGLIEKRLRRGGMERGFKLT